MIGNVQLGRTIVTPVMIVDSNTFRKNTNALSFQVLLEKVD